MSRKIDNYIFGLRLAAQIKVEGEVEIKGLSSVVEKAFKRMKTMAEQCEDSNAACAEIKRWLYDNRLFVGAQYESIKKDISAFGKVQAKDGSPLMHYLMMSFVTANDSEIESEKLIQFLRGVGSVISLSVDDFWSIPLMLRLSLFETISKFVMPANTAEAPLFVRRVAQSVIALKELRSIDFDEVFAKASRTEEVLCSEPAGIYEEMSILTKNRYRNALKKIARKRHISEEDAAKEIVSRAGEEGKHIGFYLLQDKFRTRKTLYFLMLGAVTAGIFFAAYLNTKNFYTILFLLPVFFEIARKTVDFIASKVIRPKNLPSMDELQPLPEEGRCLAVIVSLMTSTQQIDALASKIESYYRINRDENIYFGILADYKDFNAQENLHDKELGSYAIRKIEALNKKYGDDRFSLFIRGREYSKSENTYMGRERKRGAVEALAAYLHGEESSFQFLCGNSEIHTSTNYLVTLDYDTVPTNDSIKALVCKMLHPLNRAVIDKGKNRVTSGFGIMQPAMRTRLLGPDATKFAHIMSSGGGYDVYSFAAYDTYQDILSEGVFCGKGIIDVKTYMTVLKDRLPKERILSHDLPEGELVRCAIVGDIIFEDGYPSTVQSFLKRYHRWCRGDIQNLFYIPMRFGLLLRSHFKLAANCVRELAPPFVLLGLIFLHGSAVFLPLALTMVLLDSFLPVLFSLLDYLININKMQMILRYHSRKDNEFIAGLKMAFTDFCMFVPKGAVAVDAYLRSLFRMLITKRKLLEWTTAEEAERKAGSELWGLILSQRLPFLINLYLVLSARLPLAIVIYFGFMLSPLYFWLINVKSGIRRTNLSEKDKETVRKYALDIWQFFDRFVNDENKFLPPDNYQEFPKENVAHRTSPTNIGLAMLSTLSARDFGFIGTDNMLKRLDNMLTTIEGVDKLNGHLYNWYDTLTLQILRPAYVSTVDSGNFVVCLYALAEGLKELQEDEPRVSEFLERIYKLASSMRFEWLYDQSNDLFYIGYDAQNETMGKNCYDLLVSEARMTSFVTIARGDIPVGNWKSLGRPVSIRDGFCCALSWTGTMFEYLMPNLFLPLYEGSILYESVLDSIRQQIKTGRQKNKPWGVSESGYYDFDSALNYQYKAFGEPANAIKELSKKEYVVSPYSAFLAMQLTAKAAIKELRKLTQIGASGQYGFYEAVDYSSVRHNKFSIVKSHMSHHMGMSMLSLANVMFDNIWQRRFMRNMDFYSCVALLMEKAPSRIPRIKRPWNSESPTVERYKSPEYRREYKDFNPSNIHANLICGENLRLLTSDCGLGFLRHDNIGLYRFSDVTVDNPQNLFVLLKDSKSEELFSAAPAPLYDKSLLYTSEFSNGCTIQKCSTEGVGLEYRMAVFASMPTAVYELSVTNKNKEEREYEVLFWFEPSLSSYESDIAHKVFNNLFIESYIEGDRVYFSKKERERPENRLWVAAAAQGDYLELKMETSKSKLLGRLETAGDLPLVFGRKFTGQSGAPINPVCAVKLKIKIKSLEHKALRLLVSYAESRGKCSNFLDIACGEKTDNIVRSSSEYTKAKKIHYRICDIDDYYMEKLIPKLLFSGQNQRRLLSHASLLFDKSTLWQHGISGDVPILMKYVSETSDYSILEMLVRINKYLFDNGVAFDLIFCYSDSGEYNRPVYNKLLEMVIRENAQSRIRSNGGIHLVNTDKYSDVYACLEYLSIRADEEVRENYKTMDVVKEQPHAKAEKDFELSEKEITVYNGASLHHPWNWIIANRRFGAIQSDRALNFTFYENAREFKLTEWKNDIFDEAGERVLMTVHGKRYDLIACSHSCAHAAGLSRYFFKIGQVEGVVKVTVFSKLGGKLVHVKINKQGGEKIRIEYSCNMILGVDKRDTVRISAERRNGAIILQNPFAGYYRRTSVVLMADRDFENRFTTGVLSCINNIDASGEVCFCLGAFRSEREFRLLRYELMEKRFEGVYKDYRALVEPFIKMVKIETPDKNLNWLFNHTLVYQSLISRIWARTGYYQCGGAFGYRDQLQDYMNLAMIMPDDLKRHIIRSSTHQFTEGDVQHWWHNIPIGKDKGHLGVRTRCSDDMLWLVSATSEYVSVTGDDKILDIVTGYIEAPPLRDEDSEVCVIPARSAVRENVLQHCRRAMDFAYRLGPNGLLLIRSGDWNDSMNMAGDENRGESVWLSWFYCICCRQMAEFYRLREDGEARREMERRAERLAADIEKNGYDGEWYLRGYHKDGSKIGEKNSAECEIDLISQSFAVLASDTTDERKRGAIQKAYSKLYDNEFKIFKLFWPPFKDDKRELGYIKGYLEGIRENGGQYTHAAIWGAIALFASGDADKAYQVLSGTNPLNRCEEEVSLVNYRVEPYVIAADIYTNPNLYGMGGWTWYTGAAAWYYTAVLRWLYGINMKNGTLTVTPNLPEAWQKCSAMLTLGGKKIKIEIIRDKENHSESRQIEIKEKSSGEDYEILQIFV